MTECESVCREEAGMIEYGSGSGKVWLVGAGPSDPGLFTLKGMKVLKEAQVVVYDHLVGQEILTQIPADAIAIDVGKQAGNHKKSQEEINEILLKEAMKGRRVVRLKGGDPFLFGRGGEELELLERHGIPFEIVPGVTSAVAVPAYNGIPVTHRDFASSVHIITGHRRSGESLDIDFEALVRIGGTLVFLMGVKNLGEIVRGLEAGGMDPQMPAAVLQSGTTAHQRRVTASLCELEERVREAGIGTPAIIVVGKVCSLAERFAWYEKLPLAGERIVVTRPKDRSSRLAERLRELGAETISLPSMETEPVTDEESVRRIRDTVDSLEQFDLLAFTSPYGVKCFFEILRAHRKDVRALAGIRLAAIGTATAAALEERGLLVDLMPETYDGRSLGRLIAEWAKEQSGCGGCGREKRAENRLEEQSGEQSEARTAGETAGELAGKSAGDCGLKMLRVLLARAREGSRELTEELLAAGQLEVTDLAIYETRTFGSERIPAGDTCGRPSASEEAAGDLPCGCGFLREQLESGRITRVMFTSASTVRGFAARLNDFDLSGVQALCIGRQTERAAKECGMETVVSREASIDSMVEKLLEMKAEALVNS